ncbi:MAG: DUF438 domain-containing protein [Marinilabiliales bacterium]
MSIYNSDKRINKLIEVFHAIQQNKNAANIIKANQLYINNAIPSDIIKLVHSLANTNLPIDDLKTGINKFLNIMYKSIMNYPYIIPPKNSFLDICIRNNAILENKLSELKKDIQKINKSFDTKTLQTILSGLKFLNKYDKYYQIKENVLFPLLESNWEDYKCLNVMWSYHDDIRANIKSAISLVKKDFKIKEFNSLIGKIYFNMYAIKFREERILFPYIIETIDQVETDSIIPEAFDIGFPYYQPDIKIQTTNMRNSNDDLIDLKSGKLSAEQIMLIFNHLPVDITYVDENNKVRYFSTPKKRIFTRTNAIIGRQVENCHPPKSVHVVNKIVEAFKSGQKDKASFWINLNNELVLIQYFAVRDSDNNYRGVIEVSQEINEIQSLKGEKRLLDWED